MEPYDVCDGVSLDVFNAYIGELPIGLRFFSLSSDRHIVFNDLPTPIDNKFLRATNSTAGERGSLTVIKPVHPKKEADNTFGPMGDTHGLPPPLGRKFQDWVTFVVEVGRFPSWRSLEESAK
ncbi:hypothetical protein THRCLA_20381 [Thraustotheca clavata]|uniref:Uncharacterized protein n=1 Tax=Thraustotheca clavata TaxID=74557 RepID=A0A1W0A803_9STRA|nr:hypothetical protein THRCLA_20381 [Thraustotheca clavata]